MRKVLKLADLSKEDLKSLLEKLKRVLESYDGLLDCTKQIRSAPRPIIDLSWVKGRHDECKEGIGQIEAAVKEYNETEF